jgi:hypothetical protein
MLIEDAQGESVSTFSPFLLCQSFITIIIIIYQMVRDTHLRRFEGAHFSPP